MAGIWIPSTRVIQPQGAVSPSPKLPSSSLCIPGGSAWIDYAKNASSPWVFNGSGMSFGVGRSGKYVYTSTGYFSRTPSVASGPLTIVIRYTPTLVAATLGIWNLSAYFNSTTPQCLLQNSSGSLNLYLGGSYVATLTGVLSTNVESTIVCSFSNISGGVANSWVISCGGKSASGTTTNTSNPMPTEYLAAGYSTDSPGNYYLYGALAHAYPLNVLNALAGNPWQLFEDEQTYLPLGGWTPTSITAGYTGLSSTSWQPTAALA